MNCRTCLKMRIIDKYAPLFDLSSDQHEFLINTPRASAKTTHVAELITHLVGHVCKNKPRDIICFRANANSLVGSIMSDVEKQLAAHGIRYETRIAPLRIIANGCNIYFLGISGHDRSRVRGFSPQHKLIAIIGDECQQISAEDNLTHARSTFIRFIDKNAPYRIVMCGNPHEVKGHWWNVYAKSRRSVYTPIDCTWKDVYSSGLLPQPTLEDILIERRVNPNGYRFMYEGDLSAMVGGAYSAFNRSTHLITPSVAAEIFNGERIELIIWGGDGAITRDATAIVPLAIMSSGRGCVLERFFFDPLRYGRALAPSELSRLICRYLDDMESKYNIVRDGIITSAFVIDCASQDLITQLRYDIPSYHTVNAYTTKNIIRNNSSANNVFARNLVYIIDYGGYMDYATGRFISCPDPLADQLESVVWKGNKYDPAIPNDISDAFTYASATYFENPLNLNIPERKAFYD